LYTQNLQGKIVSSKECIVANWYSDVLN